MCNPSLAIDLVIVSGEDHVWVVRRKDTGQLATMGGFVNVGESVADAVARELKEEMGIELKTSPMLFGVFSDPRRDNRRHTASAVFAVHLDGSEHPVAADDVKEVEKIKLSDIETKDFFCDHRTILLDYRRILQNKREGGLSASDFVRSDGDFATDVTRSICSPIPS